jgi:hypothetical protein
MRPRRYGVGVTGEFYFMAVGGLGVSLAGFAGLIAALGSRPGSPSAVAVWRIRNIVVGGFAITFAGFGTIVLYTVTRENLGLTVRLSSLSLALFQTYLVAWESRPGPAWPSERHRRVAVVLTLVGLGLMLGNVVAGRLGLLQFLFLAALVNPVSIFVFTVRDLSREQAPGAEGDDPGEG